jgi:hypothetical protein
MACVRYKDPQDVLDYGFTWSTWLASGETISTSTWTVESGITKDSDSNTTTTTTIWLSGGTAGEVYALVNHITTSASRQLDQTLIIEMISR